MKQYLAWLFVLTLLGGGTAVANDDYHAPSVIATFETRQ